MRGLNRLIRDCLRRQDAGLSLVELLVGMGLTTLLMILVGSMFVQLTKITTNSTTSQNTTQVASNAANTISSVLGTATTVATSTSVTPAIVSGTRSSLTLYSYASTDALDPAPVRVAFTLDASAKLTDTRCTAKRTGGYWTFTTCAASSTRTVAMGLQAPSTTPAVNPLFTYLDASGQPIVIGTGSLTAANLTQVASIVVEVTVITGSPTSRPTVIRNTIVLRNLGLDPTL